MSEERFDGDKRFDSDERFERDLRSVLVEDAPRDVPDELRHRVAAVSTSAPERNPRPGPTWRRRAPLWAGALATLVVVLAVVLAVESWPLGPPSDPGLGGSPSTPSPTLSPSPRSSPSGPDTPSPRSPARPSSPSSSPSSSGLGSALPTPSSSTSSSACLAADLAGRILGWQGAAGSRIADVEISNISSGSCLVRGTPGLQLVDAAGKVLIDSAMAGPSGKPHVASNDAGLELRAGGVLRTQVRASNYCGLTPSPPIEIAVTLPSAGGRFVAVPGAGVSSADAVPPCLGSSESQITMNGWQR